MILNYSQTFLQLRNINYFSQLFSFCKSSCFTTVILQFKITQKIGQMRRKSNIEAHNNFLNRYRSPQSKSKSKGKIKLTQNNEIKHFQNGVYCGIKSVYPNQDSNYSSTNHTMIIRPSASFVNLYHGSVMSKNTSQKTVKHKKYTKQGKHKSNVSNKDIQKKEKKEKSRKTKNQQVTSKNIKESEKQIIMMILNQSAIKIQRFWRKYQLKIKTQRREKTYSLPQQLQYPQSEQSSISPVYARQNSNPSTRRQYKDCQLNQEQIDNFFNEAQSAKVLFPPEIEDEESLLSSQMKKLESYKIYSVKKQFFPQEHSNLSRHHFRTSSQSVDSLIPTPYGKVQQPIYNNGKYVNIDKNQKYETQKKFQQEFSDEQSSIQKIQKIFKDKSANSSIEKKKIKTEQILYYGDRQLKNQMIKAYSSVQSIPKKVNKLGYSNVYCMTITRSPITHTPYEDSYPQQSSMKSSSYPFEQQLKECKKKLAQSKLNKLLFLEDKFRNEAITQRSYERSMKDVSQQYQRSLQLIEAKHKKLLSGWQQIFQIFQNLQKKPNKEILEQQTYLVPNTDSQQNDNIASKIPAKQNNFEENKQQMNFKKDKKQSYPAQKQFTLSKSKYQIDQYSDIPKVCIELGPIVVDKKSTNTAFQNNIRSDISTQIQFAKNAHNFNGNIEYGHGSLEHHLSPIYVNTVSLQNSAKASSGQSINILSQSQEGTAKSLIDKLEQQPQIGDIISFQSLIHLDNGIKSDRGLKKDTDPQRQFQKVQKIKTKSLNAIEKSKDEQVKWNQHTQILQWILNELIIQFINPPKRFSSSKVSTQNLLTKLRYCNHSPHVQIYHKSKIMTIKNSSSQSEDEDSKNNTAKKRIKEKINKNQDDSYDSILADIDSVNNWLLQISYFLLDHHSDEILINLTQTSKKQPLPEQLMRMVKHKTGDQYMQNYQVISDRMFQQFEFIYMRKVAETMSVKSERYESFSRLLLCFHRALFDCLNYALLYQLSSGKDWLYLPWSNKCKIEKPIRADHAKMSLQRGINKVSNMAEYLIAPLRMYNNDFSEYEWKIYNENRISMTIHLQILQAQLKSEIWVGQLINQIYMQIWQEQVQLAAIQLIKISRNQF